MRLRPQDSIPEPSSPCLHHCGFKDGCCKNCFRTTDEVNRWKGLDASEKARILALAAQRRLAAGS